VGAKPITLLAAYDAQVIVYGHTHRELVTYEDGRMVVNPGAAGARRFNMRPCVGILLVGSGDPSVHFVRLGE
jgi:predicted phosphodiesterase